MMVPARVYSFHLVNTIKTTQFVTTRSTSTHVYQEVIPWKNQSSLTNHLVKSVFYNEGGVVALSKPYGVGSSPRVGQKQYLNAAPVGDRVFSLYDSLPDLAKKLGHSELFIASVPERYTSGVTILTHSPSLQSKIKASLQLSKLSDETMNLYYALVVGTPNNPNGSFKVGIQMSSKVSGQPLLVPFKLTATKKHTMQTLRVVYNTVGSSGKASLLAIRSCSASLHALRILCTDKFVSPILGDNMFGNRVKNVMGQDVLVGFNQKSALQPMKLNNEVLEALQLTSGQELIIPTHLHLQEVYLAKLFGKEIILRAPFPQVFHWSSKQLGLDVPECRPCETLKRKDVLSKKQSKGESPNEEENLSGDENPNEEKNLNQVKTGVIL